MSTSAPSKTAPLSYATALATQKKAAPKEDPAVTALGRQFAALKVTKKVDKFATNGSAAAEADKNNKGDSVQHKSPSSANAIGAGKVEEAGRAFGCYKRVLNAHSDDIHALLPTSDRTFVSGSKDGNLRLWDFYGNLVGKVYETQTDYTQWITTLGDAGNGTWMSGTRDGIVDQWSADGKWLKTLLTPPQVQGSHVCKERNTYRVNHVESLADSGQFIVGRPTCFTVHAVANGVLLGRCETSKNDWVYATHALSTTQLLVVTGPDLDLWELTQANALVWNRKASLIAEDKTAVAKQRPFISAIQPLKANPNHFGLSIFDGRVQVYDIEVRTKLWDAQEHSKRVWTIKNINVHCFASAGDDGCIKLWDPRTPPKSVLTLIDNTQQKARVSVLMPLSENNFVAGSCPDDVFRSKTKAQLSFWDARKG